jgi:polyhydroxyalkanoate synthesis regulator phasin
MNDLLAALTREGVLLNVSVRYWRGCKQLKPEDLGLDPGDVSERLISLGHKRLLPKEATAALSLIEGRAHALVEANTFPFLNGLAHFLPNPKLTEVTDRLKTLETGFWEAKQAFLAQYATLRESAKAEWHTFASKLVSDPDRLVATIEAAFPLPRQMDRYFGFDLNLFQIAVPERLGLDLISIRDQQSLVAARQQASQQAAAKIHEGVQTFVGDCVAALREQTAQLCDEMLRSLQTSETGVHEKTLNRLRRFIDQFKQMNFVDDTEMERQLEQVRRELLSRSASEYRDDATARARLVSGLGRFADQARQLAKADPVPIVQRFGELGRRKFHLAA